MRLSMTELNELFLEAAETERKLPAAFRRQRMSGWPDYPKDGMAYGYNAMEVPRLKPTGSRLIAGRWLWIWRCATWMTRIGAWSGLYVRALPSGSGARDGLGLHKSSG